jgi:hypothetical protein
MPSIKGSFSGTITKQSAMSLADQPGHMMIIAEVDGIQKSTDPLWNNSRITYWGVTELLNGTGSQRGYYNNVRADKDRNWGTFEAKVNVTGPQMIIEGAYKFIDGDGEFRGLTGGGIFKTVFTSETELECSWDGHYEFAKARKR